ncbi:reverse transcriptase domain-containing protein [Tanacetum coccineum]
MQKLIAEIPTLTAPMKGEELMVYLSTANEAVRSVLLVERRARQMPIHYVCRSLQGVEVNYAPMEKLALALVHADRRLRRYFQGHTIKVIMKKPINQILNSREASGRLAKWAVELGAYGITYVPSNAIKGQVLADFLDDTMAGDDPTSKGTTKTKKILEPDEDPKSSRSKEEQTVVGLIDDTNTWKMYIDGASNDHGIRSPGSMTKNSDRDDGRENLCVEGSYEARGKKTKKYKGKVLEMVKCFDKFRISHIPREENKKANALRKLAVVQCEGLMKGLLVEELNERSVRTCAEARVRRRGIRRNQADQDIYKGLKPIYQAYTTSRVSSGYTVKAKESCAPCWVLGCNLHPRGLLELGVELGEPGKKKSVLLEFAIVRYRSPNNVILGTTPGKYAWITRALTKSAKDIYPFLEVEEKLGSLIGYQYKCFLRLPKEDSHVRMSENDEEKMGFHTEEGVYCFTHKPAKKFWSYSSKEENEYSHAIRLNLFASKDNMDYEALLAGLAAFIRRGMKALHVFVGSKFLVDQVEGNRVPRTKRAKRFREEIMDTMAPFYRF